MNLNRATVIGNITDDLEIRETKSSKKVTNFTVAVNFNDDTEFIDVVVFGKQAENCVSFLSKGALIAVEGRIQTREWEDRDGNQKQTTEIVARNVQFGPKSSTDKETTDKETTDKETTDTDEVKPTDIPF